VLRLKAYAKINLSLQILGTRPDGYHELNSIMQSVSLADQLTLTETPSGIQLATTNLKLPNDSRNLAYKAAALFWDKVRGMGCEVRGVKIYIEKNIPLAAGLAGGSADAAAVLYGLNQLANSAFRIPHSALLELGAQIGSDVPFCLLGGNCVVTGRGEQVKRTPFHGKRHFVLVTPDVEVSTKWAYEAFDRITNDELRITNLGTKNDLESAVIQKYPIIQRIKERLVELGASYAQMSGSGPTVFGIVPDRGAAERIAATLKGEFARSYAVESVEAGVETIS
jgi:4-diphosphocytidyl-2-C-methyl-D-erythritol kinase